VPIYCIDTSALIAAWYERYKPNRFPKLWTQFDELVEKRRLFSSSIVLDECSRRSPELHEWLKDRPEMFVMPDEAVQVRVQHIVNTYKALVAQGKENFAADPFVIATAETRGHTVITEETGPDSLKKIPGVCRALRIPVLNLMELIDGEDWVIG
jgi:predicted nucleic acid-binding protein